MSRTIEYKKDGFFAKDGYGLVFIKYKDILAIYPNGDRYVVRDRNEKNIFESYVISTKDKEEIIKKWKEFYDNKDSFMEKLNNRLDRFFNELEFAPGVGSEYKEAEKRQEHIFKSN